MFTLLGKVILAPFNFLKGMFDMLPGWIIKKAAGFLGIGGDTDVDSTPGEDVDDIIVTSSGRVLKPNSQDSIIAAKPDGPILSNMNQAKEDQEKTLLGALGAGAASAFSYTPMGMLMGAMQKVGSAEGAEKTQPSNVNVDVNVKIGEKQLTDIIIEALASPEAGKAISPFLN